MTKLVRLINQLDLKLGEYPRIVSGHAIMTKLCYAFKSDIPDKLTPTRLSAAAAKYKCSKNQQLKRGLKIKWPGKVKITPMGT